MTRGDCFLGPRRLRRERLEVLGRGEAGTPRRFQCLARMGLTRQRWQKPQNPLRRQAFRWRSNGNEGGVTI